MTEELNLSWNGNECKPLIDRSAAAVSGVQMVVTSPLTRCVQTALISFPALAAMQSEGCPFVVRRCRLTLSHPR
jgi:hypothetical protein